MITVSRRIVVVPLVCAAVVGPGSPPVRVHALSTAGGSGYVDLHNPSSREVDLAGWSVVSCSGSSRTVLVELGAGTALPPGAHLLIAGLDHPRSGVAVPGVAGDGVALLDRRGSPVDRVATATGSPCREREAALACDDGTAPSRDGSSTDTDHNLVDFTCAPHGA
ncbi:MULTISPECIES: lamin tail domain-containing protein [unclassified Saccharothrix]|uniref:lamin tail domain-containing protein n=1 Tax=unclassified Saccharothrix TaxID=2593673 RepID=UPI00307F4635